MHTAACCSVLRSMQQVIVLLLQQPVPLPPFQHADYVSHEYYFRCFYSKFRVSAASCQDLRIVASSSQCSAAHHSSHAMQLIARVFPHPPFVSRVMSSRLSQPQPSSVTPVRSSNTVEMTHIGASYRSSLPPHLSQTATSPHHTHASCATHC